MKSRRKVHEFERHAPLFNENVERNGEDIEKSKKPSWILSYLIWRVRLLNSDHAVLIIHWADAGYLDSYLCTHTKGNPQSSKWATSPCERRPICQTSHRINEGISFYWFFLLCYFILFYFFLAGDEGKVLPWLLSPSFLSFSLSYVLCISICLHAQSKQ